MTSFSFAKQFLHLICFLMQVKWEMRKQPFIKKNMTIPHLFIVYSFLKSQDICVSFSGSMLSLLLFSYEIESLHAQTVFGKQRHHALLRFMIQNPNSSHAKHQIKPLKFRQLFWFSLLILNEAINVHKLSLEKCPFLVLFGSQDLGYARQTLTLLTTSQALKSAFKNILSFIFSLVCFLTAIKSLTFTSMD